MLMRAKPFRLTWQNGYTPVDVWELAIEKVQAGEHLVTAVLKAAFELWDEPSDDGRVWQKQAPEVDALNHVRALEDALVGEDFFASYSIEEAVAALERARDTDQGLKWARRTSSTLVP